MAGVPSGRLTLWSVDAEKWAWVGLTVPWAAADEHDSETSNEVSTPRNEPATRLFHHIAHTPGHVNLFEQPANRVNPDQARTYLYVALIRSSVFDTCCA